MQRHTATALGRTLWSTHVSQLTDIRGMSFPKPHFVLLLAADTQALAGSDCVDLGTALLGAGAVYVSAWGPGASRFEDCVDEAVVGPTGEGADGPVIMTTSHEDESLEDAVWFAANSAWPDEAYEESCRATVILTVGDRTWHQRVTDYLDAGVPLRGEA